MDSNVFTISPVVARGFPWMIILISLLALGLFVLFAGIYYSANKIQFMIDSNGLTITKAIFYGRTIPKAEIVPDRIQIVNLQKDRSFNPAIRTNGIGMPGFLSGWFRLKNKEKALLFVTDREKVLYIPTKKYAILLSVPDPEAMRTKIQAVW
jgi:hypothetical protein